MLMDKAFLDRCGAIFRITFTGVVLKVSWYWRHSNAGFSPKFRIQNEQFFGVLRRSSISRSLLIVNLFVT